MSRILNYLLYLKMVNAYYNNIYNLTNDLITIYIVQAPMFYSFAKYTDRKLFCDFYDSTPWLVRKS